MVPSKGFIWRYVEFSAATLGEGAAMTLSRKMRPYLNIHAHGLQTSHDECTVHNLLYSGGMACPDLPLDAFFSVGVHPWYIDPAERDVWQDMERVVTETHCLFVGETGLDKKAGAVYALQMEVFVAQLRLAERLGKPVMLHCVKAWEDVLTCCRRYAPHVAHVFHGFRGKPELARQLLRAGNYLSFGEHWHPDSLRECPLDRLFIETDESDVPVQWLYRQAAAVKGLSVETLVEACWANLLRICPGMEGTVFAQKEGV